MIAGYPTPLSMVQAIEKYQYDNPTHGVSAPKPVFTNFRCRYTSKPSETPVTIHCSTVFNDVPDDPAHRLEQHADIKIIGASDGSFRCDDVDPDPTNPQTNLCPPGTFDVPTVAAADDPGKAAVSRACGVNPDSLYLSVPADPSHGSNDSLYTSNDGSGHSYQLNYYSGNVECH